MTRRLVIALLVAGCWVAIAHAEELVRARTMGVVLRAGVPHLYYSARDLINREASKKLESGLPQRIVVQHFVVAPHRDAPLAAQGHSCKVVYDLWQAVYRVEQEVIGLAPRTYSVATRSEVLERCLVMRNVAVGEAHDYRAERTVSVASLIQLNPLSTSTIARIRRWLARPRGEYNVETKSFFGSFVSLFVNDRIGSAERVLRLKSQSFELR